MMLKQYYEIVDEARPLSGFFPTHADFLRKYISYHVDINSLFLTFLLLFVSHFTAFYTSSVVFCDVIFWE